MVGSWVKRKNVTGFEEEAVSGFHRDVIKIEWKSLACDVFGDEDARWLDHSKWIQRQRDKITEKNTYWHKGKIRGNVEVDSQYGGVHKPHSFSHLRCRIPTFSHNSRLITHAQQRRLKVQYDLRRSYLRIQREEETWQHLLSTFVNQKNWHCQGHFQWLHPGLVGGLRGRAQK